MSLTILDGLTEHVILREVADALEKKSQLKSRLESEVEELRKEVETRKIANKKLIKQISEYKLVNQKLHQNNQKLANNNETLKQNLQIVEKSLDQCREENDKLLEAIEEMKKDQALQADKALASRDDLLRQLHSLVVQHKNSPTKTNVVKVGAENTCKSTERRKMDDTKIWLKRLNSQDRKKFLEPITSSPPVSITPENTEYDSIDEDDTTIVELYGDSNCEDIVPLEEETIISPPRIKPYKIESNRPEYKRLPKSTRTITVKIINRKNPAIKNYIKTFDSRVTLQEIYMTYSRFVEDCTGERLKGNMYLDNVKVKSLSQQLGDSDKLGTVIIEVK